MYYNCMVYSVHMQFYASCKIFPFDAQGCKSSRRFLAATIPPFALETTWNDSFSSRRKPHPSRFPVNRLGFPGIFSSPLFALYASCSFMFLGTNIAHHSAPYFLRRSYFCLLPASRSSAACIFVAKSFPGHSRVNHNRIFVVRPAYFYEKKCDRSDAYLFIASLIYTDEHQVNTS